MNHTRTHEVLRKSAEAGIEPSQGVFDTPSYFGIRIGFWLLGICLAVFEAWTNRYFVTADAVSYMDMSDGVLHGQDWHRLINGTWSPLYPTVLGVFRRIFAPSALQEIAFDHILNIAIFLFAFASFEFLLSSIDRELVSPRSPQRVPLPRWVFLTLGYSLFIWASISQITLESLRPDMLMSGFLYLAVALLVGMRGGHSTLGSHVVLGAVLGVSYLAKAPMLPIGVVILAASVLIGPNWRRALPLAACSGIVFFLIGSLYFVPLSRSRGHFTAGESGKFNYILYADRASPTWYLTNPGSAAGTPLHRTRQIVAKPATYEFSIGISITHPLRFDPSYWTEGLKPVFGLRNQLRAVKQNLTVYLHIFIELGGMVLGFLILCCSCYLGSLGSRLARDLMEGWPLWIVGAAGVILYAPIHVEPRYVGAFFVLLWLGLLIGIRAWRTDKRFLEGVVVAVALSLLISTARAAYLPMRLRWNPRSNMDAEVARELPQYGIRPGEKVARISTAGDLGWARASRVTVVAEVDLDDAETFWRSDPATQIEVLRALRKTGVRCVVAHVWGDVTAQGWFRLAQTHYWIYPFQ